MRPPHPLHAWSHKLRAAHGRELSAFAFWPPVDFHRTLWEFDEGIALVDVPPCCTDQRVSICVPDRDPVATLIAIVPLH